MRKVKQFCEQQNLLQPQQKWLLAISGGIDSMVLLHLLATQRRHWQIELSVVHVDHMLRGEQSAKDGELVASYCARYEIPCYRTAIPIAEIKKQYGGNTQAICRSERYRYFREILAQTNADKLVTAHHADDQLESLLMALTSHATINSMQGIQAQRKYYQWQIIRPLLCVTKAQLAQYASEYEVPYYEDASNASEDYLRNRMRHNVVPLLQQENAKVAQQAVNFAQLLQQDNDYLTELAQKLYAQAVKELSPQYAILKIDVLKSEALALQRRVVLILLNYLYKETDTIQNNNLVRAILGLTASTAGNASLNLPNNIMAGRQYNEIHFAPSHNLVPVEENTATVLQENEWLVCKNTMRLYITKDLQKPLVPQQNAQIYYFNAAKILPLYVRTRRLGDRIHIAGMAEPKRVKRLFIDEKIPLAQRAVWPLLVSADDVVAVCGLRYNEAFSKARRTDDDMMLIVERNPL